MVDQKDRSRTCNVSDRILLTFFHPDNAGLSRKSRYTLFFVRKSNFQKEAEQSFFFWPLVLQRHGRGLSDERTGGARHTFKKLKTWFWYLLVCSAS